MSLVDKKRNETHSDYIKLTSGDLQNILEINKKSIEIYIEVEKQNEKIHSDIDDLIADVKEVNTKIDSIDKNLFKLVLILGGIGTSTIGGIIAALIHLFSK